MKTNTADVIMNKLTLFKFDASSLNKSLEAIGFSSIDGILGSDLINLAHIKIDFESVQLITEKENVIKALSINDKNDECPFFVISAMFNHQPLKLLVDTGASQSLLDIRTAERLFGADSVNWSINTDSSFGISPSDILNIKQQFPISFEDGDFAWDICFTAFKMNKLNQTYRTANIPPVDAILGFDFLKKHCKEMDFRKHTICLQ